MSWLLDAFELFMLNVSCNSHCFLALCCALHRITSRVIHRTELCFFLFYITVYVYIRFIFNDKQQWFCWMERFKTRRHNNNQKNKSEFLMLYMCVCDLLFYIMVRHNHHIHTYIYIYIYMRLCEVKILFMIKIE